MARFPRNDIISLVGEAPRYDLGESVGPDLRLDDLLDASARASFGDVALGYGTAQGDPRLRALIADAHGVGPDDVVLTVGGMHALFLIAFVLCDPGDEARVFRLGFGLLSKADLEAALARLSAACVSESR